MVRSVTNISTSITNVTFVQDNPTRPNPLNTTGIRPNANRTLPHISPSRSLTLPNQVDIVFNRESQGNTTRNLPRNQPNINTTINLPRNQPNINTTRNLPRNQPNINTTINLPRNQPNINTTISLPRNQPNINTTINLPRNQPNINTTRNLPRNQPNINTTRNLPRNQPNINTTRNLPRNQPNINTTRNLPRNQPNINTTTPSTRNQPRINRKAFATLPDSSRRTGYDTMEVPPTNAAERQRNFIQKANETLGNFFHRNMIIYYSLFLKQKLYEENLNEGDYNFIRDFQDRIKLFKDYTKRMLKNCLGNLRYKHQETFQNTILEAKPSIRIEEKVTKCANNVLIKEKTVIEDHITSQESGDVTNTLGGNFEELLRSQLRIKKEIAQAQGNSSFYKKTEEELEQKYLAFFESMFQVHIMNCQRPRTHENEVVEEIVKDADGNIVQFTRKNEKEEIFVEIGNVIDSLLKKQVKRDFELQIMQGNEVRQLKPSNKMRERHAKQLKDNINLNNEEMMQALKSLENLFIQVSLKDLPDVFIDLSVTPNPVVRQVTPPQNPQQRRINPFAVLFGGGNDTNNDEQVQMDEESGSQGQSSSEYQSSSEDVDYEDDNDDYSEEPSASPLVTDTYEFPAEYAHVLNRTNNAPQNVSRRTADDSSYSAFAPDLRSTQINHNLSEDYEYEDDNDDYTEEPSDPPLVTDTYEFPAEYAHVLNRTNNVAQNVLNRTNNVPQNALNRTQNVPQNVSRRTTDDSSYRTFAPALRSTTINQNLSEDYEYEDDNDDYTEEPSDPPLVTDTYEFPAEHAHVLNRTNYVAQNVLNRTNNVPQNALNRTHNVPQNVSRRTNNDSSFSAFIPSRKSTPKPKKGVCNCLTEFACALPTTDELKQMENSEQETLQRCLQKWQAARRNVALSITNTSQQSR